MDKAALIWLDRKTVPTTPWAKDKFGFSHQASRILVDFRKTTRERTLLPLVEEPRVAASECKLPAKIGQPRAPLDERFDVP